MKRNHVTAEVSPWVGVLEKEINKAAVVPQNLKPAPEVGELLSFTHFGGNFSISVLKLCKWQMLVTAKMSNPIRIKQFKQCKIIIFIAFFNSNMKGKMTIKQKKSGIFSVW